jgi:hypothetical protein
LYHLPHAHLRTEWSHVARPQFNTRRQSDEAATRMHVTLEVNLGDENLTEATLRESVALILTRIPGLRAETRQGLSYKIYNN